MVHYRAEVWSKASPQSDGIKPDGIEVEAELELPGTAECAGKAVDDAACAYARVSRARGRPRAYDPGEVLDKALKVFWQKGFAATSLDDLVEATGVNRPSLYAGFGDKESLYLKAMQRYRARTDSQLDAVLTCSGQNDTVRSIIRRYFDIMIDTYTGEAEHPLGCAFMCTALNEAPQHESILEMLQNTIDQFDIRFETFFAQARDMGFIRADQDPKALSQMIIGLTANLGVRARAGASRETLQDMVRGTTALLFGA
ncbi:TetR/AcrR family transcriptional regulator [Asticcacaulis endophyticus]|uniref:TetR family transcriptional regulator n=1 Tax=Asticcacaulis endophyticus TaxID=1395890 RepID=A0A918UNR9_9CAUL|nr:TetR/AcrR family transcriptional regulator [Asticcacaulis endophyticus]GGZ24883.1 TetR family transcriptional regulator [Asticcacaulis endophyticus]